MNSSLAFHLSLLPRLIHSDAFAGALSCKVCDSPAAFFDVVDFNKTTGGYAFGPSGINLCWHRCEDCGCLFTSFFDDWSAADFKRFIYNQDYTLLDPDYLSVRPRGMADRIAPLLSGLENARILDYGAGADVFAARMRELGFSHVESYDPFSLPKRPEGSFDIITCVEVIEHSPFPHTIFADMRSFLADDGCVVVGESLQPSDIDMIRCNWWYIAPRNGHVCTFAARTLAVLAQRLGWVYHRGAGHPHVLRAGPRFAGLADRFGPVLERTRLGAPGHSPADGFSGVEGHPGQQFQWTTDAEIRWTIDVPDTRPRIQIMVPFAHESRLGFAATCTLEVNAQPLATTIQERSIFAETEPLAAGKAFITLRTGPLTTTPDRAIGLAVRVIRPSVWGRPSDSVDLQTASPLGPVNHG